MPNPTAIDWMKLCYLKSAYLTEEEEVDSVKAAEYCKVDVVPRE